VITGYRHAFWDSPWWVSENRNAGRYNRAGQEATQYLCLHPLGVTAEFLRQQGPGVVADLHTVALRIWAARVPTDGLDRITFDNAATFGLVASDLVDDDYTRTQALGDYLRSTGRAGLIAPSAALPGTEILVLFGPRLRLAYLSDPVDPAQVQSAHITDGVPVEEVVSSVRWRGAPHSGLVDWEARGAIAAFEDPATPRI
jgi:hypothetical protein